MGERVHGWGGCSEVREGEGGSEEIASLSPKPISSSLWLYISLLFIMGRVGRVYEES